MSNIDEVLTAFSQSTGQRITFADPVHFTNRVTFQQEIQHEILSAPKTATTVSVLNLVRVKFSNTGAASVTNFTGGQQGQEIKILGDGNTTLVHGTSIFCNTGANKLLAVNKVYTFTNFSTSWIENA